MAQAGSGRSHNQISTHAIQLLASTATQRCGAAKNNRTADALISAVALHLARRLTQPPLAQLRSIRPNSGWYQSHACRRGELRAAAHAAIKIKTVVGKPGTKMPITPNAKHSTAPISSNQRSGAGSGVLLGGGGGIVIAG